MFETTWTTLGVIAATGALTYAAVILAVRAAGLRSLAQLSAFDFAVTVALGTILATTTLTGAVSAPEAAAALATLFGLQWVVGLLRRHTAHGSAVADNTPAYLMVGPEILEHNLDRVHMTRADLAATLRKHGVARRDQVAAVVMETTGELSVLRAADASGGIDEFVRSGIGEEPQTPPPRS